MSSCLAVLLAGGKGSRLHELTKNDSKPAVRFGDHARIVDFALGNAYNSGLRHIIAATQYRPQSLHLRLSEFWQPIFYRRGGTIDICYGPEVTGSVRGYDGTAAAVSANIDRINAAAPEHVVILAADHVYRMDYAGMLETHLKADADLTVAADTAPLDQASAFGIIRADRAGRIQDFLEKPANPPAMSDDPQRAFVSMGVYIFRWTALREALRADARTPGSRHDFGFDLVPRFVEAGRAVVHRLTSPVPSQKPFWRDVGTLDSYLDTHLDIWSAPDRLRLADRVWPILPRSLEGILSQTRCFGEDRPTGVTNSWIGSHTVVGHGARLNRSLVMQGAVVGRQCRIERAIIAPGVVLEPGTVIGEDAHEDARWFRRTDDGTVLVTPAALEYRHHHARRTVFATQRGVANRIPKQAPKPTPAPRDIRLTSSHS